MKLDSNNNPVIAYLLSPNGTCSFMSIAILRCTNLNCSSYYNTLLQTQISVNCNSFNTFEQSLVFDAQDNAIVFYADLSASQVFRRCVCNDIACSVPVCSNVTSAATSDARFTLIHQINGAYYQERSNFVNFSPIQLFKCSDATCLTRSTTYISMPGNYSIGAAAALRFLNYNGILLATSYFG